MDGTRRRRRVVCAFALLVVVLVATVSQALADEITSCAQLNDAKYTIGVGQGSIQEIIVEKELPEARLKDYTDNLLGYTSVSQGKIDAYAYDWEQMNIAIREGQISGVRLLDDTLEETVKIVVAVSQTSHMDTSSRSATTSSPRSARTGPWTTCTSVGSPEATPRCRTFPGTRMPTRSSWW